MCKYAYIVALRSPHLKFEISLFHIKSTTLTCGCTLCLSTFILLFIIADMCHSSENNIFFAVITNSEVNCIHVLLQTTNFDDSLVSYGEGNSYSSLFPRY